MKILVLGWGVFWRMLFWGCTGGAALGGIYGPIGILALISWDLLDGTESISASMVPAWVIGGLLGGALYGFITGLLVGLANGVVLAVTVIITFPLDKSSYSSSDVRQTVGLISVFVCGFVTFLGCIVSRLPVTYSERWGWGTAGLVVWAIIPSIIGATAGWFVSKPLADWISHQSRSKPRLPPQ